MNGVYPAQSKEDNVGSRELVQKRRLCGVSKGGKIEFLARVVIHNVSVKRTFVFELFRL